MLMVSSISSSAPASHVCQDRQLTAETQVSGKFQRPQEGVGQPAPRALRARGLGQLRDGAGQPRFGDEVCVVFARPRIHIVPEVFARANHTQRAPAGGWYWRLPQKRTADCPGRPLAAPKSAGSNGRGTGPQPRGCARTADAEQRQPHAGAGGAGTSSRPEPSSTVSGVWPPPS